MEQHPVPQHIASFEFKLFGNLTLKQFITLSIPASVAILSFFSNLPGILKYPITIIFGLAGFFMALVPINGKSFDKWIVAFVKAILAPTQRIWIKELKIPEFLNVVVSLPPPSDAVPQAFSSDNRQKLIAYIRAIPKENESPLDKKEDAAIERLGLEPMQVTRVSTPPMFISSGQVTASVPQASLPQLGGIQIPASAETTTRYQGRLQEALPQIQKAKTQAAPQKLNPHAKQFVLPGIESRLEEKNIKLIKETTRPEPKAHLASDTNYSIEEIVSFHAPSRRISFIPIIGKTRVRKLHFAPPAGYEITPPVRGERTFDISSELKKRFGESEKETPAVIKAASPSQLTTILPTPKPASGMQSDKPKMSMPNKTGAKLKNESAEPIDAQFKINQVKANPQNTAPAFASMANIIPLTSKPNVISGIVTSSDGSSLEGIILVIHDQNGIPVRALKTNKLGQFISATPLPNGHYTIEVEGREEKFDTVSLNLNGQVLSPMEIQAKEQN